MLKRCRFKQTISLQDRLAAFAQESREKAARLQPGFARDDMLKKARQADIASRLDDWASSRVSGSATVTSGGGRTSSAPRKAAMSVCRVTGCPASLSATKPVSSAKYVILVHDAYPVNGRGGPYIPKALELRREPRRRWATDLERAQEGACSSPVGARGA